VGRHAAHRNESARWSAGRTLIKFQENSFEGSRRVKPLVRGLWWVPQGVVGSDTFTRPGILFSDLVKRLLARRWGPQMLGSRGRRFKSCQPDF
jgi:hypothetical protein